MADVPVAHVAEHERELRSVRLTRSRQTSCSGNTGLDQQENSGGGVSLTQVFVLTVRARPILPLAESNQVHTHVTNAPDWLAQKSGETPTTPLSRLQSACSRQAAKSIVSVPIQESQRHGLVGAQPAA